MYRGSVAEGDKRRPLLAAVILLLVGIFAIGCGGDDEESGGGSGAGSSGQSEVVAEAEGVIEPYLAPPESVGTDVALSKKPPSGKKIVALSCSLEVCKS